MRRRVLHAAAVAVAAANAANAAAAAAVGGGGVDVGACVDRPVIHPGVWPTTGDTYALHATFDAAAPTTEGARRPPRARPAARAPAPLTTGPPRAQL